MKNFTTIILALGLMLGITSCSKQASAPQTVTPVQAINFDWVPPSNAAPRSSDVSFILINPEYAENLEQLQGLPMFEKFLDNMGDDFEELLIAKGYTLRGPYDTVDEVVFSDKTETDLMLTIEMNQYVDWGNSFKRSTKFGASILSGSLGGGDVYSFHVDGPVNIGGKVNITLYESMTQEKLWVKSISIKDQQVYLKTPKYKDWAEAMQHAGFVNPLYTALDDSYQAALTTAWRHLEPQEIVVLKKQVDELRAKKGY